MKKLGKAQEAWQSAVPVGGERWWNIPISFEGHSTALAPRISLSALYRASRSATTFTPGATFARLMRYFSALPFSDIGRYRQQAIKHVEIHLPPFIALRYYRGDIKGHQLSRRGMLSSIGVETRFCSDSGVRLFPATGEKCRAANNSDQVAGCRQPASAGTSWGQAWAYGRSRSGGTASGRAHIECRAAR